jgi:hypothetical protein
MNDSPRRRPGRPPIDATDPSVPLTVSFPGNTYAVLVEQAKHEHLTLQNWIRQQLRAAVKVTPDP